MFINVCMHLNFHSTSIYQLIRRIIKIQIQNKTPLDPIRRMANLSLASSVKSKRRSGPTSNTVTVTLHMSAPAYAHICIWWFTLWRVCLGRPRGPIVPRLYPGPEICPGSGSVREGNFVCCDSCGDIKRRKVSRCHLANTR